MGTVEGNNVTARERMQGKNRQRNPTM